jgi:hypothetical protein
MSITAQFWQYAKEAILSAPSAQTDEERNGLLELVRDWTQAALLERQSTDHDSPAEAGVALGCCCFQVLRGDPGNVIKVLDSTA